MHGIPTLYIGVAAPLVEISRIWMTGLPEGGHKAMKDFPRREINAYRFKWLDDDRSVLTFHTGVRVPEARVQEVIEKWSGEQPACISTSHVEPVESIDHRRVVAELRATLQEQPVRIMTRVGLTLQQLQRDLSQHHPELVLLNAHGTPDGCLMFEDGRSGGEIVSGERLFPLLEPRPQVLFLAACHSGGVIRRAKETAEWDDGAIVYINTETSVKVTACAAFASMFYPALLQGHCVDEAFAVAQQFVANDPVMGDFSVVGESLAPSKKFCLADHGRQTSLAVPDFKAVDETDHASSEPPYPNQLRRTSERIVGRRREMQQIINAILPLPAGITAPGGQRRVVCLTKEGGIGKTTIALEIVDWIRERHLFPGGLFELSCESIRSEQELLSRLLSLFGLPRDEHRGDLLALLAEVIRHALPAGQPALLMLDNLDDLFGRQADVALHQRATEILERMLTTSGSLRMLVTCRWPLGLSDHEYQMEIPPMQEEEARDVFLSHLESPQHRVEVQETWAQPDSPIRHLIRMSGYHPQSLRLLARQMGRKGITLTHLRDEAHRDLLAFLQEPLAHDNDQDRLKKVEVSYELSYRHLSDAGKRLFARLSRLPGGVWCGEEIDDWLDWHDLLGKGWRHILEAELDYFALVHYDGNGGSGVFAMLPPMLEFARRKYDEQDDSEWDATWVDFWCQHVSGWNDLISGRVPDSWDIPDEQRGIVGLQMQLQATTCFEQTQDNWLTLFDYLVKADGSLATSLLLDMVSFARLSGQLMLLRDLSQMAVDKLRKSDTETDLAPCLVTLGNMLRELGAREEARESFREALEIYRRLAHTHPAVYDS
uniref:tetratricopeptide repeat protein n=1 Tax=Candidatus Entotheonella palauensis TaxID=93172 RepID=UPI001177B375